MPRVFVSVLLLAVLTVMVILSAGIGVARVGRWWAQSQQQPMLKAEQLKEQQRKLEAQQAEAHGRAALLRWIRAHDRWAERYPDRAEGSRRKANALRQQLGLPLRDYASEPARPVVTVMTAEIAAALTPRPSPRPTTTVATPVPEIPRLLKLPLWYWPPPHEGEPSESAVPQPELR